VVKKFLVHGICVSVECDNGDILRLFEHELAGFPIVNITTEVPIIIEKVDTLPRQPSGKPEAYPKSCTSETCVYCVPGDDVNAILAS